MVSAFTTIIYYAAASCTTSLHKAVSSYSKNSAVESLLKEENVFVSTPIGLAKLIQVLIQFIHKLLFIIEQGTVCNERVIFDVEGSFVLVGSERRL